MTHKWYNITDIWRYNHRDHIISMNLSWPPWKTKPFVEQLRAAVVQCKTDLTSDLQSISKEIKSIMKIIKCCGVVRWGVVWCGGPSSTHYYNLRFVLHQASQASPPACGEVMSGRRQSVICFQMKIKNYDKVSIRMWRILVRTNWLYYLVFSFYRLFSHIRVFEKCW